MKYEQSKRIEEIRKIHKPQRSPETGELMTNPNIDFLLSVVDEQEKEIKLLNDALKSASEFSDAR